MQQSVSRSVGLSGTLSELLSVLQWLVQRWGLQKGPTSESPLESPWGLALALQWSAQWWDSQMALMLALLSGPLSALLLG